MNIEDLRLPCEHGEHVPWTTGLTICDGGGRVPTQAEINALAKPDLEAVAAIEHEQWVEWSQDVAELMPDHDPRLDRWEKYWVPYHMLDEDMKEYNECGPSKPSMLRSEVAHEPQDARLVLQRPTRLPDPRQILLAGQPHDPS